jgi:hypothetical protein
MRAASAFQISLQRFGAWRVGVGLLAGLGTLTVVAWLGGREPPAERALLIGGLLAALGLVLLGISLARVAPTTLRWDGIAWHLGSPSGKPLVGELAVMIDLGAWMLLRFRPEARGPVRAAWLPVQRRGIELQWHALRCALYSPRPHRVDGSAAGP